MTHGCDGCGGESIQEVTASLIARPPYPGWYLWRRRPDIEENLHRELLRWLGTPYMAGQRVRGIGVDCVQLIAGIFDNLFRRPSPTPVPRLRADAAIHCPDKGFATVKALLTAFPCDDVDAEKIIEPGDVLVVRASFDQNGPANLGHCLIAGTETHTAIHAILPNGVCMAGTRAVGEILKVYRPKEKHLWA